MPPFRKFQAPGAFITNNMEYVSDRYFILWRIMMTIILRCASYTDDTLSVAFAPSFNMQVDFFELSLGITSVHHNCLENTCIIYSHTFID